MEFEIQRTEFLEGLRLTQGVVERRNTLPILSNTLIEPVEGGISILATDLDIGVRRSCTAKVKGSGALTVSARKRWLSLCHEESFAWDCRTQRERAAGHPLAALTVTRHREQRWRAHSEPHLAAAASAVP